MRSAVTLSKDVTNDELIQRLIGALKKAGNGPLMVKQIAAAIGVSLTTAGKYVDIAEARGLVRADSVRLRQAGMAGLVSSTRKRGVGVRYWRSPSRGFRLRSGPILVGFDGPIPHGTSVGRTPSTPLTESIVTQR